MRIRKRTPQLKPVSVVPLPPDGPTYTLLGHHGQTTGPLVSSWSYQGTNYMLLRDKDGGYHGYAEDRCGKAGGGE